MYQLTNGSSVINLDTGASIPLPPNESEGFAYQAWLDAGNTPLPAPVPTLAEQQATMWERIKDKRDLLSDTGGYMVVVATVNKWFHSDAKSKTQQLGLARKADRVEAAAGDLTAAFLTPSGGTLYWKTMDGSFVPMTGTLARAIFDAAEAQDSNIFSVAEQHKTSMQAAVDPMAYDFSSNWPATFQG